MQLSLLTGVVLVLTAGAASATPLLGSFPGAVSVNTPGSLLDLGQTLTLNNGLTTGAGTGDFAVTSLGTPGITSITSPLTLANGQDFSFLLNGYGTFSGTSLNVVLNPISTATNRAIAFDALGTFTPSAIGGTADSASITGSFTQTGGAAGAVSFSFTFNSPASVNVPVPEPAAIALLGLGIAGLAFARRRAA